MVVVRKDDSCEEVKERRDKMNSIIRSGMAKSCVLLVVAITAVALAIAYGHFKMKHNVHSFLYPNHTFEREENQEKCAICGAQNPSLVGR